MSQKWTSKYSPGKKVSTHQYILEIVCGNSASKEGIELPDQFWKLKDWKWRYIKQSNKCKILREKHGDLKVLDFVIKNKIYSLSANWIDEAISKWEFTDKVTPSSLDVSQEMSKGRSQPKKTNIFEGLE